MLTDTIARRRLIKWLQSHTQQELAAATGISQQAISTYAVGSSRPPHDRRLLLEAAAGIPAADWMTPDEKRAVRRLAKRKAA